AEIARRDQRLVHRAAADGNHLRSSERLKAQDLRDATRKLDRIAVLNQIVGRRVRRQAFECAGADDQHVVSRYGHTRTPVTVLWEADWNATAHQRQQRLYLPAAMLPRYTG